MEQPFPEEMSRDRHATGVDTNGSTSHECLADRVSVSEAAEMVGVTQSAIRKRVQRGTIPWDEDSEGRIYVLRKPLRYESRGREGQGTGHGDRTVVRRGAEGL